MLAASSTTRITSSSWNGRAPNGWSALGFPLTALSAKRRRFVDHRCEIDYPAPARLNDALDVSVEPIKLGAATIKRARKCDAATMC